MLEQAVPEGLYPVERTHDGALLVGEGLMKGPELEFMKDCFLWKLHCTGAEKEHEEEGVKGIKCCVMS